MKYHNKLAVPVAVLIFIAGLITGCGFVRGNSRESLPPDAPAVRLREVNIPVSRATGAAVEKNDKAVIDYSNASDGYVMVQYHQAASNELMVLIDGPNGEQYSYMLNPGGYEVFPLTEGNGQYVVTVCEQIDNLKFKVVIRAHIDVVLTDPLSPFLRPSQHVNYNKDSAVVKKAAGLTSGTKDLIGDVSAVYSFVINHISYDAELAQTVESGYLPDVDAVLASGKGICFDYAAVMTAMLRSLGIPTKLVFGYTGEFYHAWISVYSEEEGWIDNIIFFDAHNWMLMDPTFASGNNQSGEIMSFIGEGADYVAKFQY